MATQNEIKKYKVYVDHATGYDKIDVYAKQTLREFADLASSGTYLFLPTAEDGGKNIAVRATCISRIVPASQ